MAEDLKQSLDSLHIDRESEDAGRRRRRRWPWVVGALVVLAGLLVVLTRPPVVTTEPAGRAETVDSGPVPVLNASGYVVARRQATVSSKVTGRVAEVQVEEGLEVTQGQVLARLDDSDVKRSLALAEARLEQAKRAVAETEAQLELARRDYDRVEKLATDQVRSQADLDAARAQRDSLDAALAVARQEVVVAGRAVAVEQQNLENTVIRAPFAGVAISKNAQPGEMISPVSAGGGFTRTGITTVVDMSSLEIEVDVNESYIHRVSAGQAVEARLNAYPDWKIPAHVITTIPAADRDRATVRVRIAFDRLDPRLLPDMGVKVAFLGAPGAEGAPEYAEVPAAAVRSEGAAKVVYVAVDGKLSRRVVETGRERDGRVEILSGVAPDEAVVVAGPARLADGKAVRVEARGAAAG
jgi:RND family efflux transporter MFP subunit